MLLTNRWPITDEDITMVLLKYGEPSKLRLWFEALPDSVIQNTFFAIGNREFRTPIHIMHQVLSIKMHQPKWQKVVRNEVIRQLVYYETTVDKA